MILKAGIETGYERYKSIFYLWESKLRTIINYCNFLAFGYSIMELVDAAIEMSVLQPIKETILQVEGVKVET